MFPQSWGVGNLTYVDPSFDGEHHFYLHGIHFIDSSSEFKEWNAENQVCYFPHDRNLSYFASYTQDNCLLECRYVLFYNVLFSTSSAAQPFLKTNTSSDRVQYLPHRK